MKKTLLASALALALISTTAVASETYFFYQHSYATENRFHGDEFGLLHDEGDVWFKIKIHLYGKNKDVAFDESVSNSYSFYTGYHFRLTDTLMLSSSLQGRFYSGGTSGEGTVGEMGDTQQSGARYTPGVMLRWQVAEPVSVYAQYRYDYRKIARGRVTDGEARNRHRHRYEVGASYALLETLHLGYKAFYYQADYVLSNNKKLDYQQDVDIDWQFTPAWQLNLGAEDIAKSATTRGREARLKAGFTYTF